MPTIVVQRCIPDVVWNMRTVVKKYETRSEKYFTSHSAAGEIVTVGFLSCPLMASRATIPDVFWYTRIYILYAIENIYTPLATLMRYCLRFVQETSTTADYARLHKLRPPSNVPSRAQQQLREDTCPLTH